MNRGLLAVAGCASIVALIAVLLLALEKNEKEMVKQENNDLKNRLAVHQNSAIEVKPKTIVGFAPPTQEA